MPRSKTPITITNPELLTEWDDPRDLSTLTPGSTYRGQWVCKEGHKWTAEVRKRAIRGQGCPYCSGNRIIEGVNDLKSQYPDIAAEWHHDNIVPCDQIHAFSNKSAKWKGACGHQWEAIVANRTKHNSGCPICQGKRVKFGDNDLSSCNPRLASEWSDRNTLKPEEVTTGSSVKVWWCCANGHEWQATIKDRKRFGCPSCSHSVSKQEDEISNFLNEMCIDHKRNVRNVIPPKELDIWVPMHRLAIEFHGLHWHTEDRVGKNLHRLKYLACKEKGIQLIQIWEDDWRDKQGIVKRMIAHKLGASVQEKVYARNTTVKYVPYGIAKRFLDENHIQGGVSGSAYLGLYHHETLVSCLVIQTASPDLVVSRYATGVRVVGGFQKLISFVEGNFEYRSLVSFADFEVSNGRLYEVNGWLRCAEIPPDYKYVYEKKRHHKFGFRKDRFMTDPNLKYVDGLTEKSLASLNNIPRIWDSGKAKYMKLRPDGATISEEKHEGTN